MRQQMTVEMDDGSSYDMEADGRDIRKWEAEYEKSWLIERISFTSLCQLAFIAGQRTNVLNGQWPSYESFDAHCVSAIGRREPVIANPTQPDPTDDSSVSSPSNSTRYRRKSNVKDRQS